MNPTLREPEIMEIMPYDSKPLRVGDVVIFLLPDADQLLVHRVVRVTPTGISTLGDNNTAEDAFLVQPKSIKGRVVAGWRGQKRRKIAGGLQGRLTSRWLLWRRILNRGVSPLLHPLYLALSHRGLIAWLLPAPFRPRIVVFYNQDREQLKLLLGQRVIGRYDNRLHQWQIQRPFQLLVNKRELPRQQDDDQTNKHVLTEWRQTINSQQSRRVRYELILADGSHWEITAGDKEAADLVAQLGCAMRLKVATDAIKPFHRDNHNPCRLLVQVDAHFSLAACHTALPSNNNDFTVCVLHPCNHSNGRYIQLIQLSLFNARDAQAHGGVFIHGALAERDGQGIILAAPGGTGKTTASNRFPAPWRSLCDDTTLVVRDPRGNFWAHPWPTWSRFLDGGPGGSWDVQHAVPLKGVFFLTRAAKDRVERVGQGQAVSLLLEYVRQASMPLELNLNKEERYALHLERFNNLCALTQVVPAYVLHISLTGAFWQEIEQAL